MSNVCFVDTETTGLHPDRHAIWEVALITPNGDEHVWQFPVDEMTADPFALDIGHYWERRWSTDPGVHWYNTIYEAHNAKSRRHYQPKQGRAMEPSIQWCRYFSELTAGYHLCGAVPSFDEERLRQLLNRHGVLHRWHYHLIDVEALAVGYLHGKNRAYTDTPSELHFSLPWRSNDLSRACGVEPPGEDDRHTALGDARWAKRLYERIMLGDTAVVGKSPS